MLIEASSHQISKVSWIPTRRDSPLIKAERLGYLSLQRPDLEKAEHFFLNYGLKLDIRDENTLYLRGRSGDNIAVIVRKGPHKLIGFGVVASAAEAYKF